MYSTPKRPIRLEWASYTCKNWDIVPSHSLVKSLYWRFQINTNSVLRFEYGNHFSPGVCYEDYSNTEIDETKLNITSDHDGPVEGTYLLTSLGMFPKLKHLEIWIAEKTYFEFSVWNDPPVLLPNLFNITRTHPQMCPSAIRQHQYIFLDMALVNT